MQTVLTALCTLPLAFSLSASAWAQSTADDAAQAPPTAELNTALADPTSPDAEIVFGGPEPVVIVSGELRHEFSAELAITPAEMERGLMWREALAPDAGMLFHYSPPRRTSIWMVNTLIPLDILYIRENGRIAKIVAYAQPGSRRGLPSDAAVAGVLEIPAGRALELGIVPGDRVEHRFFSPAPDLTSLETEEGAEPVVNEALEGETETEISAPADAAPADETPEDAAAAADAPEDTD